MSVLTGFWTFRMDCFTLISKSKVSSRPFVEAPNRFQTRPFRTSPNNNAISLDFISRTEEPRLLLIVPEHACRCGYSRCRGFIVPNYASEAKVDGDEAVHRAYLYYFLRSDAKTGFGRCWLGGALHVMMLLTSACTLGASVIP